ncbi:MAG: presenilin family intramembrane aspartyl protease [Nanoarchaeota archaeon]|nr:hypothetical protein [Nanoarchaeota archaeon]
MKHSVKATLLLLTIFLVTQLFGILVINSYIDHEATAATGETVFEDLPIGDRPDFDEETSYLPIIIIILVGTLILLLLIKLKAFIIWKLWFLIAVFATIMFALGAFVDARIAIGVALILAIWKVFKPNPYVHNFTEILVYSGLAAIFVPIFNLMSIIILLLLISAYDAYAVWKSKHMITLAKSQSKAGIFAGLLIPYKWNKDKKEVQKKTKTGKVSKSTKSKKVKIKTAILGGGDIGFPLIFTGVILKEFGVGYCLVIPVFTTIALALLFYYGDKNKFYPAMPFISTACFVGLGVVYLLQFLV